MESKTIVVMEQFFSQLKDLNLSKKAFDSIREEIDLLSKFDSSQNLFSYLKNQNAKKLQGHTHQFKYRMNRGDRIFFTYGKYINNVPDCYKEAVFIYGYSRHEEQDQEIIPDYDNSKAYQPAQVEEILENEQLPEIHISNFTDDEITKLYLNNHSFYVFDETNLPDEINDADVLLSEEQDFYIQQYAENPCPTLVLGGAGTGKTVMELHFLHDFESEHPDTKNAYFTQSFPLLKKSEERYKYIVGTQKSENNETADCEFINLKQFCIQLLNKNNKKINVTDLVGQEQFYKFLEDFRINSQLKKNEISDYSLWAEIRGTIKGSLDENWCRYKSFVVNEFPGNFISILKKNDLITQKDDDLRHFRIKNPEDFKLSLCDFRNPAELENYHKIEKKVSSVDAEVPLLPYEDYLKITEENSTLSKEQRKFAYEVAQKYQDWLDKSHKYDDNDLIRMCLALNLTERKFDFMVIDEIQDYTELQLYFILSFSKNYNYVIMAGDEHQIVNPTIFSEERLKKFFYLQKNKNNLEIDILKRNFRCPEEVVNVANKLTELSKKLIASKGENNMEQSSFSSEKPVLLSVPDSKINSLIEEMLVYPNVVFLVPDENSKNQVIQSFGQKKYENANNPIISTIAEIKGMEYQYVVNYNLIGNYDSQWTEILEGNARHTTKYRYFFNLFYVGLTRVQKFLTVVDKTQTNLFNNFDFNMQKSLDTILSYLALVPKNQQAWIKQIEKETDAGNLDRARILLNNVDNQTEKLSLLLKIELQECLSQSNLEKTFKILILLDDNKQLEKYSENIENPDLIKLQNLLSQKNPTESYKGFGLLVDKLYNDFDDEYRLKLKNRILKRIAEDISDNTKMVNEIMDIESMKFEKWE